MQGGRTGCAGAVGFGSETVWGPEPVHPTPQYCLLAVQRCLLVLLQRERLALSHYSLLPRLARIICSKSAVHNLC